jgi:hypothetical protein
LLESGPRTLFAIQFLKFFFACEDVDAARYADVIPNECAGKKIAAPPQLRNFIDANNPYFIDVFAIAAKCIRQGVEVESCAMQCCACMKLAALQSAGHAANTQFVKRNTVFFILL